MQKTEKHCKNQCFCYHKTTKISPKTGPKTQKSASEPGHLRNRNKKMLQTKKLRSKSWKTRVFFTFRLPILDGRVHEQVSSVLFFTVFFEGERNDLSKTQGFGRKMGPPPGKPVTFYECHPEDHAPAPSVRADFIPRPPTRGGPSYLLHDPIDTWESGAHDTPHIPAHMICTSLRY